MSQITEEQRIYLEANGRYQALCKQYVKFIAQYLQSQNGNGGNTAGLPVLDWAKARFISAGIALHPNDQNYVEWAAQMTMRLKGQDVWIEHTPADPDENAQRELSINDTIDGMLVAPAKFEEITNDIFAIRATQIPF